MSKYFLRKYLISLPFLSVISKKKASKKNRISILVLLFWSYQFNQSQCFFPSISFFLFCLFVEVYVANFRNVSFAKVFLRRFVKFRIRRNSFLYWGNFFSRKFVLIKAKDAVYNGENFFSKVCHWTFTLFV